MGLLPLAARVERGGLLYKQAALVAAGYLMSLQVLDSRDEQTFGGLREHHPQTSWSYPRDGATGGMARSA